MDQATDPSPHSVSSAPQCSKSADSDPSDACRPSDAHWERLLAASLAGSCGDRCTVKASAEAIASWIRRHSITVRYQYSIWMLKYRHAARQHACRSPGTPSGGCSICATNPNGRRPGLQIDDVCETRSCDKSKHIVQYLGVFSRAPIFSSLHNSKIRENTTQATTVRSTYECTTAACSHASPSRRRSLPRLQI